jgi:hypothetical protein
MLGSRNGKAPLGAGLGVAVKTWMWVLLIVAVAGPLIRYGLFLPGRMFVRWLWRKLPDGRIRRALFKKVATDQNYPTWPKLPPGA